MNLRFALHLISVILNSYRFLLKCNYDSREIHYRYFSVIQSSSAGKSYLCVNLLNKLPGVHTVFRREKTDGVPFKNKWSYILKDNLKSGYTEKRVRVLLVYIL